MGICSALYDTTLSNENGFLLNFHVAASQVLDFAGAFAVASQVASEDQERSDISALASV